MPLMPIIQFINLVPRKRIENCFLVFSDSITFVTIIYKNFNKPVSFCKVAFLTYFVDIIKEVDRK